VTRRNLDTLRSDINNDAAMLDTARLEALPPLPTVIASADCIVIHSDHAGIECGAPVAPNRLGFETRNTTRDARCDRAGVARL
jgi:hypothetical protein